jgi:aerobic-type carbon monoxide dehydrogenase small subunit (CoxS/CutS family)
MPKYRLTINGENETVDVDADTPLLWVLRDTLGMTGTKFGCGAGVCGACTVLDGNAQAVRSCQLTAADANGKRFTTIEGLSADGVGLHPCQRAWLEEDVAQCGYCQAGMIMTACALLKQKKNPSDADIDGAMSDLVCRCGSYVRIRKAVHTAARLGGAK